MIETTKLYIEVPKTEALEIAKDIANRGGKFLPDPLIPQAPTPKKRHHEKSSADEVPEYQRIKKEPFRAYNSKPFCAAILIVRKFVQVGQEITLDSNGNDLLSLKLFEEFKWQKSNFDTDCRYMVFNKFMEKVEGKPYTYKLLVMPPELTEDQLKKAYQRNPSARIKAVA